MLHWDSLSLSCVHMLSIVDWMECKGLLLVLRFLLRRLRRPVLPPIISSWSKESGGGSGEFIVDDTMMLLLFDRDREFVAMVYVLLFCCLYCCLSLVEMILCTCNMFVSQRNPKYGGTGS